MTSKKVSVAALSLAVVLMASGCSGGKTTSEPNVTNASDKPADTSKTLDISWVGQGQEARSKTTTRFNN
ncbi:hypothetical protein [Paenibacillus sp. N3.4]|uniref:hypothetical protein n=1 Tax=Paenibacillus sp. N3.4 TaxID=2603222 RepID=UPI0011CC959F|nr:hypothetical protein [Paenibacillus sp. N3.4]TXK77165.1 hypothetical protein FU659_23345 [Paenibacillus sp. N3.4]